MSDQNRLARAFVIIQQYNKRYSPEVGLSRGTIFPELYMPYLKGRTKDE
ncbi:MAG: spore coat associated protein CotJA [Firmicutes bacterium]|nr:spore coat associated protein CotJA [Bacillota bacterium]MDD4264201.1 spore coat associated protein CotJA [Bacillota bacterium]MDD4693696.1 spore coat associated protein CotJA [Bacillota bacterium]